MDFAVGGAGASPYPDYGGMASGNRINSAADDAAGQAISERMDSAKRTYDASSNNLASGRDALNIADGALGGVSDYLQRMNELAIQAGNGLMSDSDKKIIQNEIDQLKLGINESAGQARYNTKGLLDGSQGSLDMYAVGSKRNAGLGTATTDALGLTGFDVTKGDFDISAIEKALEKVSSTRSSMGASTNGLESSISYLQNASYNTASAFSRIKDLDIAGASTELKKNEALQKYQVTMQSKKMENERLNNSRLFSTGF